MATALPGRFLRKARFCTTSGLNTGPKGFRPGDLLPSLAAIIPQLPQCKNIDASKLPWVQSSESFFETWSKVGPCMPKYAAFLQAHKKVFGPAGIKEGKEGTSLGSQDGFLRDLNKTRTLQGGSAVSSEVEAPLAEFYLAVALRLRPQAIEAAGSDSKALLETARSCAEEDFEPFIEKARDFVSDYDPGLHKALEDTCPFYEVDDGLFWHANFDVAAPAEFQHFLTALGHGSGQGWVQERQHTSPERVAKVVDEALHSMNSGDPMLEPARRAAQLTYEKWLEASSMPIKGSITKMLMEHGFIIGKDVYDTDTLLPQAWRFSSKEDPVAA